ncbi:MAG: transcription termination factor NusA [Patescibacteria group bacterium]|jgi:N utilization substance protein A
MSSEIQKAIKQICDEKNISESSVIETIEAALAVAYRKDFGEKDENIKVEFNLETAGSRVFDVKTVVEDMTEEEIEKAKEEEKEKREKAKEENRELTDEERVELFNPKTDIMISAARELKKDVSIGDEIRTEKFPSEAYGRMAAQTAKQVIIQKLREAERDVVYNDYKNREGEIINATIQRVEGRVVLVDIGQTTAVMPPQEQIDQEHYNSGQRIKVYIVSVKKTTKGPEIVVSRSHPEMVKKLFTMEVPEIANGSIDIKAVAREAGSRTKIAVISKESNIDPVGSCVGQRGTRVQTIIAELGGEKIDIIEYDEDPIKFIINSLSPAKVISVKLDEKEGRAIAEVKEDQLSLAIGKSGQNVRLSAKLTGLKIDIIKEGETVEEKNKAKNEIKEEKSETSEVEVKEEVKETEDKPGKKTTKKKASAKKEDKKDK